MENITTTLEQVSDATLAQPITITVDVFPQTKVQRLLQHWGIAPKKKGFVLHPICLGSLIKISKIILGIELKLPDSKGEYTNGNLLNANYEAIEKHGGSLAQIIAVAIQNNKHPVNEKMVRFILQNFTTKEMMGVLSLVLKQMDLTNFMSSIILVRGLNVLDSQTIAPVSLAKENEMSL